VVVTVNGTSGALEAQQALLRELRASERLLWSGIPAQGLRFQDGDALAIPFVLLWCLVVALPTYQQWERRGLDSDAVSSLLMLVVGLGWLVGRYLIDGYRRARTYYGVTDQRVLIIEERLIMGRETTAIGLVGLWELSLKERADKSGSITFGPPNPVIRWRGDRRKPSPTFQIEGVRHVYDLIHEAQVAARREASSRR